MPLTREQRTKKLEVLEKEFSDSSGIYVTDFTGINVAKISKFRRELRGVGAKYLVVKDSLARLALEKVGKGNLVSHFRGPVGVALARKDSIGPARVIKEFKKENKDILGIKIAYVDGALFDEKQIGQLADLPSREILLSQLLSCLQAPVANLAGTLNGILSKLVGTLEAVRTQKESQGQQ